MPRITRLTAHDRDAIRAHLLRLDDRGRFRRFTTPMPDRAITRYVDELDFDTGLFLGLKVDGEIRGLAELICFTSGGTNLDAEAAFTVEPAWQGLGHGRALMEAALRDAAQREVARIVLYIQPQNLPMRRIAERHSFRITLDAGEILATRRVIPDNQPLAA